MQSARHGLVALISAAWLAVVLTPPAPSTAASSVDLLGWAQVNIQPDRIFGLEPSVAAEVLQRATRLDALPDGYAPSDLIDTSSAGLPAMGVQRIRRLIVDDTRALIDSAGAAGYDLYVGSGFRSQAYQQEIFRAQIGRFGSAELAERYSARPGHSQHQLGTTIDFTSTFRGFRGSDAAQWLELHAHEFGFILPYTEASRTCTGYIDEPWHARWVGRQLASGLQGLGYQVWTDQCADDAVAAVRLAAGLDLRDSGSAR